MLQIHRRPKKPLRLEMTSLIDCVFLLLIFFMLSSSFLTPSISLTLPAAANTQQHDTSIVVSLDTEGQLYVNRQAVTEATLATVLREKYESTGKKDVTFRGDKSLRFERFLQTLAAIRASGATSINVSHEAQ